MIILTNNPDVKESFEDREVLFIDGGYRDVLIAARDRIHRGDKLLTHPLMGSLKPNETPYRSIVMSGEASALDPESLQLIENAIAAFDKFAKATRPDRGVNTPESMLADFRLLDKTLITGGIE
ncbi:MAG: GrdX family protein [Firmicutes bacterium]|nr:GrdX family protein [Bacillota bacterium]